MRAARIVGGASPGRGWLGACVPVALLLAGCSGRAAGFVPAIGKDGPPDGGLAIDASGPAKGAIACSPDEPGTCPAEAPYCEDGFCLPCRHPVDTTIANTTRRLGRVELQIDRGGGLHVLARTVYPDPETFYLSCLGDCDRASAWRAGEVGDPYRPYLSIGDDGRVHMIGGGGYRRCAPGCETAESWQEVELPMVSFRKSRTLVAADGRVHVFEVCHGGTGCGPGVMHAVCAAGDCLAPVGWSRGAGIPDLDGETVRAWAGRGGSVFVLGFDDEPCYGGELWRCPPGAPCLDGGDGWVELDIPPGSLVAEDEAGGLHTVGAAGEPVVRYRGPGGEDVALERRRSADASALDARDGRVSLVLGGTSARCAGGCGVAGPWIRDPPGDGLARVWTTVLGESGTHMLVERGRTLLYREVPDETPLCGCAAEASPVALDPTGGYGYGAVLAPAPDGSAYLSAQEGFARCRPGGACCIGVWPGEESRDLRVMAVDDDGRVHIAGGGFYERCAAGDGCSLACDEAPLVAPGQDFTGVAPAGSDVWLASYADGRWSIWRLPEGDADRAETSEIGEARYSVSLTVGPHGRLHASRSLYMSEHAYLTCDADCLDPARWSAVTLGRRTGDGHGVAVNDEGRPAVYAGSSAWLCESGDCRTAADWTALPLPHATGVQVRADDRAWHVLTRELVHRCSADCTDPAGWQTASLGATARDFAPAGDGRLHVVWDTGRCDCGDCDASRAYGAFAWSCTP